jgi:hypothetical protein
MYRFRKLLLLVGGLLALSLTGCDSGPAYVPVSGVVTLNGLPYKNAIVTFQPLGSVENPNPGRGSTGTTDENGRFTLVVDDRINGAVVGKHLVRIFTKWNNSSGGFDPALGTPDGDPKAKEKVEIDPIPVGWNAESKIEFEVVAGGTDQAHFKIDTKKKPK